jgi:hypothetical protein
MYYEDIFTKFYEGICSQPSVWSHTDGSGAASFYSLIISGKALTYKQGQYLIRILEKYKQISKVYGFDYTDSLKTATWKAVFREIDLTKKLSCLKDEEGILWICFKFPFQTKEIFEKEFDKDLRKPNVSKWDNDKKVRLLSFNDFNLIRIHAFAMEQQIEIDESFMFAMSEVEQVWQSQSDISPYCKIEDGKVTLVNANSSAQEYWDSEFSDNVVNDLLTAKHMGFKLDLGRNPESVIEQLAVTTDSNFYIVDHTDVFKIYKEIKGKVAVLLDRNNESIDWIKSFIKNANDNGIPNSEIRVCFRSNNNDTPNINQWIKDEGLGGPIEGGKMLVFQHQPPKWLFSSNEHVKLIITNFVHPAPSSRTQDWMTSHPCVLYMDKVKASTLRNQHIVNL